MGDKVGGDMLIKSKHILSKRFLNNVTLYCKQIILQFPTLIEFKVTR